MESLLSSPLGVVEQEQTCSHSCQLALGMSPTSTSETLPSALFSLSSPSLKAAVFCLTLPWDSPQTTQCWGGAWLPTASHSPGQKCCQITLMSPAVTSVSRKD